MDKHVSLFSVTRILYIIVILFLILPGAISGLPGAIPGAVTTAKEVIVTGLIDANVGVWSYVAPELTKLTGPCSINDTEGLQLSENAYRE